MSCGWGTTLAYPGVTTVPRGEPDNGAGLTEGSVLRRAWRFVRCGNADDPDPAAPRRCGARAGIARHAQEALRRVAPPPRAAPTDLHALGRAARIAAVRRPVRYRSARGRPSE